jgi:hypothetical protein
MTNYETITDAYNANREIRGRLKALLASVKENPGMSNPAEAKWSIPQIVEHIAIVAEGTGKIVAKLTAEARKDGRAGDGRLHLSPEFGVKGEQIADIKVEAPERVHPTGSVTIHDAVARLDAAADAVWEVKPDLETFDGLHHTFPHPYFGNISACEWLVLGGLHELRHIKQIERLIGNDHKKAPPEGG